MCVRACVYVCDIAIYTCTHYATLQGYVIEGFPRTRDQVWWYLAVIVNYMYIKTLFALECHPTAYHIQFVILTFSKDFYSPISPVVYGAQIIIILTP